MISFQKYVLDLTTAEGLKFGSKSSFSPGKSDLEKSNLNFSSSTT